MLDFFTKLLDTSDFPPRWQCGTWTQGHGWLHVLSDITIFGAYAAIPIILVYFIMRRRDIPFPPLFWLFAAFIFFCGAGHLIEATIFWQPWYRLSGLVKLATAIVSWAAVVGLVPVIPQALVLPNLARMFESLKRENQERRHAQEELRRLHEELERRVEERTAELAQANSELERFNRLAVGREQRMIQLKGEVNEMARAAGREPPYELGFMDPGGDLST